MAQIEQPTIEKSASAEDEAPHGASGGSAKSAGLAEAQLDQQIDRTIDAARADADEDEQLLAHLQQDLHQASERGQEAREEQIDTERAGSLLEQVERLLAERNAATFPDDQTPIEGEYVPPDHVSLRTANERTNSRVADDADDDKPEPAENTQSLDDLDEALAAQADAALRELDAESDPAAQPQPSAGSPVQAREHDRSADSEPGRESAMEAEADAPAYPPQPASAAAAEPVNLDELAEQGFFATAGDVAAELDDQPEQRRPTPSPHDDQRQQPERRRPRLGLGVPWWIVPVALEAVLRNICALLNWPLRRCSPQLRSTIGWAGLLTLFNGLFVLLWALLR